MLEAEFCFSLKSELSGSWDKPVTAESACVNPNPTRGLALTPNVPLMTTIYP